ncbi:hypothetical protein, partial [Klebsiella pneumoniae]|uniref:hypothetical protein n=2 Tax=Klebsiella/Raoultella group TaxID=2890311 RepID=UPI002010E1F8
TGISGAAGAEDGEEKAVCIGLPHKVHTVPVVSVRPRVALYFVNIFPEGNKSFCSSPLHNRLSFKQKKMLAYIGPYWPLLAIVGKGINYLMEF